MCAATLNICESGIQGIHREVFISQLADDTTLFLRDASQIPLAINCINLFSKASGLNLNLSRCELKIAQHPHFIIFQLNL